MLLRLIGIGLLALTWASAALALTSDEAREGAVAAIGAWVAATNSNNPKAVAQTYTGDAVFLPAIRPGLTAGQLPVLKGRDSIETFFGGAFKTFTDFAADVTEAGPLGDSAVWFVTDLHVSGPAAKLDGNLTGVAVRDGGIWRLQMGTVRALVAPTAPAK